MPTTLHLGLVAQVVSPVDADAKYELSPGFYTGTTYEVNSDWAAKLQLMHSFPSDEKGDIKDLVSNLSLGVTYIASVESVEA